MKKFKIGYFGAGTWGTALSTLLANKGYNVVVWDRTPQIVQDLSSKRKHPKLGSDIPKSIQYVSDLKEVLNGADFIVESVTSRGIRPLFEKLKENMPIDCPIVITSKGIEQKTGLLFPEVLEEVLGKKHLHQLAAIGGPSHAEEVIKNIPSSVVGSAYDPEIMKLVVETFNDKNFRVYPNSDLLGVCFGGAMKNIIAIACGISDGLNFGDNTKAALMTRGLHEMRKLAISKGCNEETLNGLSGLGDLIVTCASTLSRNYRFGRLIAKGLSCEEAEKEIGMVVEGAYTVVSAKDLGKKFSVALPITDAIYSILYENLSPKDAVKALLQRAIKEKHL
jgi:glycerol-3-phosphate dehydrogenase (NAD(P)+)